MKAERRPIRCDACGKFISYDDLESRMAIRKMITPDSHFTSEEWENICFSCRIIKVNHFYSTHMCSTGQDWQFHIWKIGSKNGDKCFCGKRKLGRNS